MEVVDTGSPISVPVGNGVLGRILRCYRLTRGRPRPRAARRRNIRFTVPLPALADQDTKATILETGIKVIDLICPFTKGGKVGAFGGAGVGKTVVIHRTHQQHRQGARRFLRVRRRR